MLSTALQRSDTDLQVLDAEIQADVSNSLEQHVPGLLTAHAYRHPIYPITRAIKPSMTHSAELPQSHSLYSCINLIFSRQAKN